MAVVQAKALGAGIAKCACCVARGALTAVAGTIEPVFSVIARTIPAIGAVAEIMTIFNAIKFGIADAVAQKRLSGARSARTYNRFSCCADFFTIGGAACGVFIQVADSISATLTIPSIIIKLRTVEVVLADIVSDECEVGAGPGAILYFIVRTKGAAILGASAVF